MRQLEVMRTMMGKEYIILPGLIVTFHSNFVAFFVAGYCVHSLVLNLSNCVHSLVLNLSNCVHSLVLNLSNCVHSLVLNLSNCVHSLVVFQTNPNCRQHGLHQILL